ncbi:Sulfite exporter TauE/SafE, partial [Haemophilus influenzae]
KLIISI